MARILWAFCLSFLVVSVGCLSDDSRTASVASNPFGHTPPPGIDQKVSYTPAPLESAARVDALGHKIVKANPQLGAQPVFRTIGSSQPEIFHQGTTEINITDGLVKQCATEGQLAAVLCYELARMVAQREAVGGSHAQEPERNPPMHVQIGNDGGGSFGAADQLHRYELAKYEKERRQRAAEATAPPDPRTLARGYLTKAGFAAGELDFAAPLLSSASDNNGIAKQLTAPAQPKQ